MLLCFSQALERSGARPGGDMMAAVTRATMLLCSGRVMVGPRVPIADEAAALTALGGVLIDHRLTLALNDEMRWRRVVIVIVADDEDDEEEDGDDEDGDDHDDRDHHHDRDDDRQRDGERDDHRASPAASDAGDAASGSPGGGASEGEELSWS